MAPRPTLLQLDPHQVEALDLIAKEQSCSRSHLVREAINDMLEKHRNRTIAEQYREGYTKFPQKDEAWVDEATRRMILEEPW